MLVFPSEFRQSAAGKPYPAICFSYISKDRVFGEKIFLPMPPGLEISDGMQYDAINLGQIGDLVVRSVAAAAKADNAEQAIKSSLKSGYAGLKGKIESGNAAAAAQIASNLLPVKKEEAKQFLDFGARQVIAPNSNTAFRNSNIRTFPFKFKMVARSAADSETIKKIVNYFRVNMYPGGNTEDLILEYPGTWRISFMTGVGSSRNTWIPAVYESFLTSFNSTYNASTNMFHADDSPVEVDVSLQFQEVKALNKIHVEKLNNGIVE